MLLTIYITLWVNQLFLWDIFNSKLLVYQRVVWVWVNILNHQHGYIMDSRDYSFHFVDVHWVAGFWPIETDLSIADELPRGEKLRELAQVLNEATTKLESRAHRVARTWPSVRCTVSRDELACLRPPSNCFRWKGEGVRVLTQSHMYDNHFLVG